MFCLVYVRRYVPGARLRVLKVTFALSVKTPRASRISFTLWTPSQSWVTRSASTNICTTRYRETTGTSWLCRKMENDEGPLHEGQKKYLCHEWSSWTGYPSWLNTEHRQQFGGQWQQSHVVFERTSMFTAVNSSISASLHVQCH